MSALRLGDARLRLGLGVLGMSLTATAVRADCVGGRETRAFRAVNDVCDGLYPPVWAVMQLGALGAAPLAAGAAWAAGERALARRLLIAGSATWALSKVIKRIVGRPRPRDLLGGVRVRGREASGLGYLSGHAGVAVALAVGAAPRLGRGGRVGAAGAAAVVGLARMYVGAHLPLDVVGGASLGLAADAAVALWEGRRVRD